MTPRQRLELAKALSAIGDAERGPTAADLNAAPLLEMWRTLQARDSRIVLWGEVTGHPQLGTDQIITSRLISISRERGWARSASRWYRLGQSFEELEAALVEKSGASSGYIDFDLPGYSPIQDPALIDRILADYVCLVRRIEARHRISGSEDRT